MTVSHAEEKTAPRKVGVVLGKLNPGGKKTLSMQYLRNVDQAKVQFHFICDADSVNVPEAEIMDCGGVVHYVAPYQKIFSNMRDMYGLFRREHFDIVHAYNSTMNVFPMAVAKAARIPIRISESLSMAHEKEPKTVIKMALRPFSGLFATHFLACGSDCGKWQFGERAFEEGRIEVFKTAVDAGSNSFDPELRASTRKSLGVEDSFLVGFIGRFEAQKNPLFIIEVFSAIRDIEPSAMLLLIGDGSLRESMTQKISELGVADNVRYLGIQEDIVRFYQAMDCFLLPSLYEGLPVVGLEAQCSGLPVYFSSNITREVAFCDLGHFFSLDLSPDEWAARIVDDYRKRSMRSGQSELAIANGFDSKCEGERLQSYYLSLIAETELK